MNLAISRNNNQNVTFGRFIKIKDANHKLKAFKSLLNERTDDILSIKVKKPDNKYELYIFSENDCDELLELTKKVPFAELRNNIETYFAKKPKEMSLKKAKKLLLNA